MIGVLSKLKLLVKYIKCNGKVTNLTISQVSYGNILRGKRIIVTGGSSGIGLAMAKKFLSEGATVLITGRNKECLCAVETELNDSNLKTLQWNVTDFSSMDSSFGRAIDLLGGFDVLVNNAGFVGHREDSEEFWDNSFDTNAKAVFFLCKKAISRFEKLNKGRGGKIINVSSMSSYINNANPYGISKTCVNRITKGFAKECAPKNIIVNAIAPGYTSASINKQNVEENAYHDKNLIHRVILPEDIAELAAFLCSDAANAIVGQIIAVDGGTTL